jgi:hypothetical protein
LAIYFEELKHTKKMQRSAKPNGVKRPQHQTSTRAAATWKEGMDNGRQRAGFVAPTVPLVVRTF